MIKLPKNLQKQNFYDALKRMLSIPGWEIFEEQELVALKSPARLPFVNMVWGNASIENIHKAMDFFSPQPFQWYLTQEQEDCYLLPFGFRAPEPSPEMVLDLNSYAIMQSSPQIKIIQVTTDNEFNTWARVAAETFHCTPNDIKEFFQPLIKIAGDIPYLAFYNEEPVATSLLYCDNQIAGIYAMSTREKFRRKGLGFAVAEACIKKAKNLNIPYAVLYASQQGEFLYKKMGFQTVQVLKEYYFEPSNPA